MTDLTPLDQAHADMQDRPDDNAARLRFYERLADSVLFLMLAQEVDDASDKITPETFDLADGQYVLVFDREERLAAFSDQTTPYVSLSGRTIVSMLADQGIGLGVNLDVAPSSILLPATVVDWLNDMLGNAPKSMDIGLEAVEPPVGLPESLITALDIKLATAMGLAPCAYLVSVSYAAGGRGHLLAFVDAVPEAQPALAQAVTEALTFSGIEAGALDVGFFRSAEAICQKLERVGLRFDLPQAQQSVTQSRPAPGSDPEKPPRLK
jgi:hypothetical protein